MRSRIAAAPLCNVIVAMAVAVAIAAGCALRPGLAPAGREGVAAPPGTAAGSPAQGTRAPGESLRERAGMLVVTIRWPNSAAQVEPAAAYRAQLLPDSAAHVDITVRDGSSIVASRTVAREAGPTTTVTIKLPVASNLQVDVKARPAGYAVAIASGTGTLSIYDGQTTGVNVTLTPEFRPAIDTLSPSAIAPGQEVTIAGDNLQPAHVGAARPTIEYTKVGGGKAPVPDGSIIVEGDGRVRFMPPDDVAAGELVVTQDGVPGVAFAYQIATATLTVSAAGTIPASAAAYRATVERDQARDGTYEITLFTTDEVAATGLPMTLTVPRVGNFRVTLDAYPASNRPTENGGSIAVGTAMAEVAAGDAAKAVAPPLASRYPPAIDSASPPVPALGGLLTISGSRFLPLWRSSEPVVKFAGSGGSDVIATITSASDGTLVVRVPDGAITGNLKVAVDGVETVVAQQVGTDYLAVAGVAGMDHALEVLPNGTVLAWGDNAYGQLGEVATWTNRGTPGVIPGLGGVVGVGGGGNHSLAVRSDGSVWAWGRNTYGQLGDNSTGTTHTPQAVSNMSGAAGVFAGSRTSHAFKSDGSTWGWGYDTPGILANGAETAESRTVPVQAQHWPVVTTLAGTVQTRGTTDGASATFDTPRGIAVDHAGNVYLAEFDKHYIRKITPQGVTSTYAGAANSCGLADGSLTSARFCNPLTLAIDGADNIYVTDYSNHSIRKISTTTGVVSTVAGPTPVSRTAGYLNANGSEARFSHPYGLAVDGAGNVFVGDSDNNVVRKIDAGREVTTLAGSGVYGYLDGAGEAAQFQTPASVAVDGAGNVYAGDMSSRVRKIDPGHNVTTLNTGIRPSSLAVDGAGNVYAGTQGSGVIHKISPAGVRTRFAGNSSSFRDGIALFARFWVPGWVTLNPAGTALYVSDDYNFLVRKIVL